MTTASDYGTYRLVFEAPTDQITPGVEMTLPGEANLDQMLSLFEAFLKASGYYFDGDLQITGPEKPTRYSTTLFGSGAQEFVPFSSYDFGDDGFSFVGNPFASSYSSDTISFAGAGIYGGMAEDIVKF